MDAIPNPFKKGMIILWSGNIESIPGGWALCNGSNDTPDLRNNFVVGAGDTYAVAATGGTLVHSHLSDSTHTHTLPGGSAIAAGGNYAAVTGGPGKADPTGETGTLPPYYALAYIMKL